jgi:hypothetical protein
MIDDYTNEDGASILEDDELIGADEFFIKRFVAALALRLDRATAATISADNFRIIAQTLGEITKDEALVAALNVERRRRVKLAEKGRKDARTDFYDTLHSLEPSAATVVQGARFAVHEAVSEQNKTSQKLQDAKELRDKADDQVKQAEADLQVWTEARKSAEEILSTDNRGNRYASFKDLAEHHQEGIAADALAHYKDAQSHYRDEIAAAQGDYADRLRSLRQGQNTRLTGAVTRLSGTTPPALPDGKGEERGTKISLRAVR